MTAGILLRTTVTDSNLPFHRALATLLCSHTAIRRSTWPPGQWMTVHNGAFVLHDSSRRDMHYMDAADILANDWETASAEICK